jgi:hypothetical protein
MRKPAGGQACSGSATQSLPTGAALASRRASGDEGRPASGDESCNGCFRAKWVAGGAGTQEEV